MDLFRKELRKNANVTNDHRSAATVAEAITPECLPPFLEPSIPETINPYETISEDYVPWRNVPIMECVICG